MKKWITAVAFMTFAATLAFAAPQEGPGGHRNGPPPSFATIYGEKLALTNAQRDQIAAIEKGTRDENAAFFESSRELMGEYRAAKEANDTAKLDALKPRMDANRERMMEIRKAELAKILPILTTDQRTQFDKLQAEREARRKEHEHQ